MYQKAITELQEHCKQCKIGQAIDLLMEFPAQPDEKPAEPTRTKKTPTKPTEAATTKTGMTRTEKPCNKCKVIKPIGDFTRNKNCLDGHEGTCNACKAARVKERYYKAKQSSSCTADPKKLHACTVCDASFKSLDTLDQHQKMRHSA